MWCSFQEMFARKDKLSKGVKGCSHLLCPQSAGDKYRASVKWGLPALTRCWLLACALEGERVEEEPYRAGSEDRQPPMEQMQDLIGNQSTALSNTDL